MYTCTHDATPPCPTPAHTHTHHLKEENEPEMDTVEEQSCDSRGFSGWDKVDKLARALVSLNGLCVSPSEAKEIERLYNDLVDYDKRPLVFQPVVHKPPKGRFARTKRPSHPTVDHMKRYLNFFIIYNTTNYYLQLQLLPVRAFACLLSIKKQSC